MPGYTQLSANINRVPSIDESFAPRAAAASGNTTNPPIYKPPTQQAPSKLSPFAQQTIVSPSFAQFDPQTLEGNYQVLIKSAPATPLLHAPVMLVPNLDPYSRSEALMKQNQSDYFFKPYPEPVPKESHDQKINKHKDSPYSPDCDRLYKCLTLTLPQLRKNRPNLRIVMEGPIIQLGLRKPVEKKRYLFICDDFMLLCKKMGFGKFAPKWFIPLNRRKAIEDIQDSNYKIQGVEFRVYAPKRDFTFFAASPQEKDVWIRAMSEQLAVVLEREKQRELAKLPQEDYIWFDQISKK